MGLAPDVGSAADLRHLRAVDVEELAAAQPGRNRRYVQLRPGTLCGDLLDARLGNVQILRERLNVGMLVRASPPANLVPFGILLSCRGEARFRGADFETSDIAQATGEWDIRFDGPIDSVSAIFDRAWFDREAQALLGHAPPAGWFQGGTRPTSPIAARALGMRIATALDRLAATPEWLDHPDLRRQVQAELLRASVDALRSADDSQERRPSATRRRRAVRVAIESLTDHPGPGVTVPDLCRLAAVSERTLEYGFREQLGVTPVAYLRLLRLNGVRRDLLRSDPQVATVTQAALRWGFLELGRFAGEYRRLFGELPSETLRRG